MALSREQYVASLGELDQNISVVKQQLIVLELQKAISKLFLDLNESSSKSTCIPDSIFLRQIAQATTFFCLEDAGEEDVSVTCDDDQYHVGGSEKYAEFTCWWTDNELETICKDKTDKEFTVKMHIYQVSPAWYFPGCEPKPPIKADEDEAEEIKEEEPKEEEQTVSVAHIGESDSVTEPEGKVEIPSPATH